MHEPTPSSPVVSGPTYDATLRLLDRQIIDPEGKLVAKVDDLALRRRPEDGRFVVTALLTGPGALGPRLGGRLGRWCVAVWKRLRAETDPAPGRIPWSDVVHINSAVHVGRSREALAVDGFEQWVDFYVTDRIPGATRAPR